MGNSSFDVVSMVTEFLKRYLKPAVFVISIRAGRAEVFRGTVVAAFLRDCEEICSREGVVSGTIYGVRLACDGIVSLDFSGSIPDGCRQMLLNTWGLRR